MQRYNDRLPRFPVADDFAFSEPEIEVGWFDIRLTCLGQEHKITSTYLCEPFAGFINHLLELDRYYKEPVSVEDVTKAYETRYFWQGEPWCYEWTFWPREGREVNVRLVHHSDFLVRDPDPKNKVKTLFEACVPSSVLLRQWYEVGKAILIAYGLIGYRNAWINTEFPLRDFRDLHETVTGTEFKAVSVEDDIRFLSLFTKAAAGKSLPEGGKA